jgi:hypothetical protein
VDAGHDHRIFFAFMGFSFSEKARLARRKLFALCSGIKKLNLQAKRFKASGKY